MNRMRVAEEKSVVVIQKCHEIGIDTMKKAMNSPLRDKLAEAILDFVTISISSQSYISKANNIINENVKDIAVDIAADIMYSNNVFIDKIFKVDDDKAIFCILSRVIKFKFIDMLRKKVEKITDDIYNHTDIKAESSNTDKAFDEKENISSYITIILNISNLYSACCFVMTRFYNEYKPKELFEEIKNIKNEREFVVFAFEKFKFFYDYEIDVNSIKKIGFKQPKDAKAISDAARCVAMTLRKHISELNIIIA